MPAGRRAMARAGGLVALLAVAALAFSSGAGADEAAQKASLTAISTKLTPALFWARAGWKQTVGPCPEPKAPNRKWLGVTCTGSDVTALNLSKAITTPSFLRGELPWAQLEGLTALTSMDFSKQGLVGTFAPADTPRLPVEYLNMDDNSLTSFTSGVGNLAKLSYLSLVSNDGLKGNLNETLGAASPLVYLAHLNIKGTQVDGPFPEFFANLANLTFLDTASTGLNGDLPFEWSSLVSLQYLRIRNCRATGTLPPTWSALTALTSLDVANNTLLGTFPEFLGQLNNTKINLALNKFFGPVPQSVWGFTQPVNLTGNYFNGSPPSSTGTVVFTGNCFNTSDQRDVTKCEEFYNTTAASLPPPPPGTPALPPPPGTNAPAPTTAPSPSTNLGLIIGLSVAGGVLILILIGLLVWFLMSRRDTEEYDEEQEGDEERDEDGDEDDDDDHDNRDRDRDDR